MKSNKGFNLLSVIIIICVTSIISGITTGVIVTNSYKSSTGLTYNELLSDENLNEFLEVYSSVVNNYYEDVDTAEMVDTALDAMLEYLGDNYTTYLDSSETKKLEESLAGTYRGIGISFVMDLTTNTATIESITASSPAEKAGLMIGDVLLSVDGTDITDKTSDEIQNMIRNSSNDSITLVVSRNGVQMTFNIDITSVLDKNIEYELLDNNIGYIQMKSFSKTLDTQVNNALNDLENQGMQKLIIDLRSNTGGYLESAEATASLFLEKGKLIYSLENKDTKADYYDETDTHRTYPIVVILNEMSASASEILAAALKDSYGAVFVGTTSFGKGLVQQTYNLSDGSMAKYTSAKWLRPNGECINGIGLKPDYEVAKTETYDENGYWIDNQLQKAIEVISTL